MKDLRPFTREEVVFLKNHGKEYHDKVGYKIWDIFCGDVMVAKIMKLIDYTDNTWYYKVLMWYGINAIGTFNRGIIERFGYNNIPKMKKKYETRDVIPNMIKPRYDSFMEAKDAVKESTIYQLKQFFE